MACQKNILELPLSASAPNPTDVVIFTLADGTSVIRTWGSIMNNSIPDDLEVTVAASGGTINNGDTSFTLSQFIGKRLRVVRAGVPQYVSAGEFTWNSGTGLCSISPAAFTGERFLFMAY